MFSLLLRDFISDFYSSFPEIPWHRVRIAFEMTYSRFVNCTFLADKCFSRAMVPLLSVSNLSADCWICTDFGVLWYLTYLLPLYHAIQVKLLGT